MAEPALGLTSEIASATDPHPIVVVGTGPVGMRFVREILRRDPTRAIVMYGNEPWAPYNRVQLSSLLAGSTTLESLATPLPLTRLARVTQRLNCPVLGIDRRGRRILDADQREQPYDALVLATGSRPFVPDVPGTALSKVFTFRNLGDVEHLLARITRSRHTLILGGGLLGLEAARAMQRGNTEVTVVQRGPRLMDRQLDDTGAALLQRKVEALGIRVVVNASVAAIHGEGSVTGVTLSNGEKVACDTVVIAAGIVPNRQLALDAGLPVGLGIQVDDAMRTADPHIYAIGECAEHRGQVYGIVAPGFEQASVAAHIIMGGEAHYEGSLAATSLKVVGERVFSAGRIGEAMDPGLDRAHGWVDPEGGRYRQVVTRRGRLVGATAIGPWDELARVREGVLEQRRLRPWHFWRLRRRGQLWPAGGGHGVAGWPADTIVCNCMGVSRGRLGMAMATGCKDVAALKKATGASSVCGSCQPLLEELVGAGGADAPPARPARGLLGLSLLALALSGLVALLPAIAVRETVQGGFSLDDLWTDGLYKQISGFTLLGLGLIGLLMSARKHLRWFRLGAFPHWRLVHVILGVLALAVLVLHSGLALGANLNQWLMLNVLALMALGALSGGFTAVERVLGGRTGSTLRRWWTWAHILVAWPLPVLLGFHVLTVYYF